MKEIHPMFPGPAYSRETELIAALTPAENSIQVMDITVFYIGGQPSYPNTAVLENGYLLETIKYNGLQGNTLTGVTRATADGDIALDWPEGTKISRRFTADDLNALQHNVRELDEETRKGMASNAQGVLDNAAAIVGLINDLNDLGFRVDAIESIEVFGGKKIDVVETEADLKTNISDFVSIAPIPNDWAIVNMPSRMWIINTIDANTGDITWDPGPTLHTDISGKMDLATNVAPGNIPVVGPDGNLLESNIPMDNLVRLGAVRFTIPATAWSASTTFATAGYAFEARINAPGLTPDDAFGVDYDPTSIISAEERGLASFRARGTNEAIFYSRMSQTANITGAYTIIKAVS